MKTQQEIVLKAKAYAESIGNEDGTSAYDYVMGYNQCQEDMADKKYTEEDIRETFMAGIECAVANGKNFEQYINSLNKQENEK
jgi:hypothetical protein